MSSSGIREVLSDAWEATKDLVSALSHPTESLKEIMQAEAEAQREAIDALANGVSPDDVNRTEVEQDERAPSIGH